MLSFPTLIAKLWRYGYGAKGSLYPQGTDGVEVELPVGTDGDALVADSAADAGMSWQTPSGSGGVDPSAVSALSGLVASKAPLLSPRLIGTPTKNGVPLATTADIPAAVPSADPAETAGLRGVMSFLAPLLSPRFIGTPTKNGVALATTADIPAATSGDSDQIILPSQIFGA